MTRRDLLRFGVAAATTGFVSRYLPAAPLPPKQLPMPLLDPLRQPRFMNPLPVPPVINVQSGGHFNFAVRPAEQFLGLVDPVSKAPLATKVWGYEGLFPGPTILAKKDVPITVQWRNELVDEYGNPLPHLLPVDSTLHWADPLNQGHVEGPYAGPVPIVTHVHGGHTSSDSDGLPDAWYTPGNTITGSKYNPVFTYDHSQEGGTIWYHDHALGITRLNVYAGLAGFYLLRDENEEALIASNGLPSGPYEFGLAIQDRMFDAMGQLHYPSTLMGAGMPGMMPPEPTVLPEFFGDHILVNGMAWPYMEVEPRPYRFRLLNGSDSRFYDLFFSTPVPILQVGTDLGLLNSPVARDRILIAPGERIDVVVDFSKHAGASITVRNNAKSPFPRGGIADPRTVGQIMQFRVTKPLKPAVPKATVPANLRPLLGPIPSLGTPVRTRKLLLAEGIDMYGRMKPALGTTELGALDYSAPITENPRSGDVEVWEFYNTTPDAHPVHLHLVGFQVQNRQKFAATVDPVTMAISNIRLQGQVSPAPAHEKGWKDTAIAYPGEVLRVITRFDRAGEYVWHCHILSHEDHEMMRPYEVLP